MAVTTTVLREAGKQVILCQGCGYAVRELDPHSVVALLPFDHSGNSKQRAFECCRCEAIIFETELVDGRFIPPQMRDPRHPAVTTE